MVKYKAKIVRFESVLSHIFIILVHIMWAIFIGENEMKVSIINVLGSIAGYIFMALLVLLLLGIVAIMSLLPTIGAIALWQCLVGML